MPRSSAGMTDCRQCPSVHSSHNASDGTCFVTGTLKVRFANTMGWCTSGWPAGENGQRRTAQSALQQQSISIPWSVLRVAREEGTPWPLPPAQPSPSGAGQRRSETAHRKTAAQHQRLPWQAAQARPAAANELVSINPRVPLHITLRHQQVWYAGLYFCAAKIRCP